MNSRIYLQISSGIWTIYISGENMDHDACVCVTILERLVGGIVEHSF